MSTNENCEKNFNYWILKNRFKGIKNGRKTFTYKTLSFRGSKHYLLQNTQFLLLRHNFVTQFYHAISLFRFLLSIAGKNKNGIIYEKYIESLTLLGKVLQYFLLDWDSVAPSTKFEKSRYQKFGTMINFYSENVRAYQ